MYITGAFNSCQMQYKDCCYTLDSIIHQGELPLDWNRAYVTPVYKKGPRTNPSNYRPISFAASCWNTSSPQQYLLTLLTTISCVQINMDFFD